MAKDVRHKFLQILGFTHITDNRQLCICRAQELLESFLDVITIQGSNVFHRTAGKAGITPEHHIIQCSKGSTANVALLRLHLRQQHDASPLKHRFVIGVVHPIHVHMMQEFLQPIITGMNSALQLQGLLTCLCSKIHTIEQLILLNRIHTMVEMLVVATSTAEHHRQGQSRGISYTLRPGMTIAKRKSHCGCLLKGRHDLVVES
mmetsp:Transcript_127568/g.220590  ORF Transcript_127568/g.220590 Transcript_127568/m.220590 type:complete len:204 (+) Transcript_127568:2353-2964(+)